jgi:hypothetical protein
VHPSTHYWLRLHTAIQQRDDDGGFVTAEHLGVTALSIAVLVVIFAAMQTLGVDIVNWMRTQLSI